MVPKNVNDNMNHSLSIVLYSIVTLCAVVFLIFGKGKDRIETIYIKIIASFTIIGSLLTNTVIVLSLSKFAVKNLTHLGSGAHGLALGVFVCLVIYRKIGTNK